MDVKVWLSAPRASAVPAGDDVLGAAGHRGTGVERPFVDVALGRRIVPGQQCALGRRDRYAQSWKVGRSAFVDIGEEYHRGPRPLTAPGLLVRPVVVIHAIPVDMRGELLPHLIALALDRLAVFALDAEQIVDPPLDLEHERLVWIEVARLAGAVGLAF